MASSEEVSDVSRTSPVNVKSVPAPLVPSAQSALPVRTALPVRAYDRDISAFEQADPAGGDTVSTDEGAGEPTTASSDVDREPQPVTPSPDFAAPDGYDLSETTCCSVPHTLERADPIW